MRIYNAYRVRKQLKAVISTAETCRLSREDILPRDQLEQLTARIHAARAAARTWIPYEMEEAGTALEKILDTVQPKQSFSVLREYFDIFVVAISVAMAFRAYYYQPFNIPTGSMQPTLYGIHATTQSVRSKTLLDHEPLATLKWLVTGERFRIVRAQASGTVTIQQQSPKPGFASVLVGGTRHLVPSDMIELSPEVRINGGAAQGQRVKRGDVLWAGKVIAGDFIFVNRWLWNFRHPRRGDVMVFSTNGITALMQGTHYIKRMAGLPGETVQIAMPSLLINGTAVMAPLRIKQIATRDSFAEGAPPYAGFQPAHFDPRYYLRGKSITSPDDVVKLRANEYYALGDNSSNSLDSRYWGPVPESNLRGVAAGVYWPFTSPRFGFVQ